MQKIIKLGDPQPAPCKKCGDKYGYVFSDNIAINYQTEYNADGSHYGGQYSDYSRMLHKGKTCYCANCGRTLPFKMDRSNDVEEII